MDLPTSTEADVFEGFSKVGKPEVSGAGREKEWQSIVVDLGVEVGDRGMIDGVEVGDQEMEEELILHPREETAENLVDNGVDLVDAVVFVVDVDRMDVDVVFGEDE